MKKRLFLTSLVAVGCVCPIFAARAEVAKDDFPSNGYMLENKTYADAATYGNMGVYDGAVTATAEYEDILYQIGAGTYLPAGATVAEQCPANSYCPGVTDATYNEGASQGATSCPSGYPNSDAGASSNTQCYTACTVSMVEHATAVDGNDYYGAGTDTCAATECEGGYHVEGSVGVIEQTPLIDVDYTMAGNDYGYISADGGNTRGTGSYAITENNTWAAAFDYGVVYGRASCQATLHDPGLEYIMANLNAIMGGTMSADQVRSDLTPIVGDAKANYFADVIAGMADGTKGEEDLFKAVQVVFGVSKDALFSTTDTGQYCYCQMTGFQSGSSGVAPASLDEGSDTSGIVSIASAPWVFDYDSGSADDCADGCADYCAYNLHAGDPYDRVFRGAVFGSLGAAASGTCEANEIRITWTDAAEADVTANNAGVCTYGGDIRTPVRAATKPGKTFVGWKFDVTE